MGLMSLPSCVIGIDISKSFLDCFLHPAGMVRRFGNDSQGHQALIGFVAEYQAFGVLEATGPYDRALCRQLHQAGLAFHRANPRKARQFARAAGFLAKTDRVDARMLALYGATMSLAPEAKPDAARQVLRTLVERRDQLVAMRKSERIRLAQPHCGDIDESLRQMMEVLDRQIAAVNVRIDTLVTQVEALAEDQAILRSAPGVGPQTASVLLALCRNWVVVTAVPSQLLPASHRSHAIQVPCAANAAYGAGANASATRSIWPHLRPVGPVPSSAYSKPCAMPANLQNLSWSP